MHVLLTSIGTDGDIFPFIGLGITLRAKGHAVTLAASSQYQSLAAASDLSFHPLVSASENQELFDHPDFWHPRKTGPLSAKWGLKYLERQFEALSSLVQDETVIVSNPGVFAAALVSEKRGCPLANLILQPWLIPSSIAPPLMPGFRALRGAPPFVWKLFWRLLDFYGAVLIGRDLNRFRSRLGLKRIDRIFRDWLSPQLAVGLFPDWFAAPQSDWPDQIQLTGFPLSDGRTSGVLPAEVIHFCDKGSSPVVFTFGTGMRHSASLFRLAAEAITRTNLRAIFLTKHRDQLPEPLSTSILHCEFASFQRLIPKCSAVVHHGGIGTLSQSMKAGIPQLILPICFDQSDNGARVKRLGVGDWLNTRRQNPQQVALSLAELLTTEVRQRCHEIKSLLDESDGLERAAQKIESLGRLKIKVASND